MDFEKKEMIDQLKFEILMLEKGGYSPSVRAPRQSAEYFRDSVTCLNAGLDEKKEPCSSCFLSQFVPPELRDCKDDLCQKIPLNDRGDTLESLKAEGNPDKMGTALLSWLKATVARLEQESVKSK
jgi:hypothetical protein